MVADDDMGQASSEEVVQMKNLFQDDKLRRLARLGMALSMEEYPQLPPTRRGVEEPRSAAWWVYFVTLENART